MAPRISVVVPCRNMGHFLPDCLDSIVAQDYPQLEIIVIDGNSTDDTVQVIERYSKHVTHWVSEPDEGQSDAINKGIARASGDLVAWLNADDYYLPGALALVAAAWAGDQQAPFYFGDGLRVDENKQTKSSFVPDGVVRYNEAALKFGLNYILQPSTFMNRAALNEVGGVDLSLHYGMDWDLWLRLTKLGNPRAIQAKLSASREYAVTKTSTGGLLRIDELKRIAQKHTGRDMTPGILCYLMDEMLQRIDANADLFSDKSRTKLTDLWASTSALFARLGARPDGFPSK